MKILVTGGAGYIGSHTVKEFLRHGSNDITVVDDLSNGYKRNIPNGVEFIEGDFSDISILNKMFSTKFDAVIHFAASKIAPESVANPEKYYDNNVAKSIKLLQASIKNGVKYFIFSSSAAVYGDVTEFPITESFKAKPTNPYGWSKLMFEQVLNDSSMAGHIKSVSLRYFNAGGADPDKELGNNHQKGEDVMSVLMTAAKNNTSFTIFGNDYDTEDSTCVRDIVHVSDLASAHVLALQNLTNGGDSSVINFGSEKGFSIKEIVEITKGITNSTFEVQYAARRLGDIETSIASSEKAHKVLGWNPVHSNIEEIIKTAWEWEKR